jgi:hypothetical protein
VRALTRFRCARGQTSAEYLGALLIVCAIVAVLVTSGAGGQIRGGIRDAICWIAGTSCETDQTGPNGEPLLSECVRNSSSAASPARSGSRRSTSAAASRASRRPASTAR